MPRTLKETFDLIRYLHLDLAESGRYHKVPFSKRDKIIVNLTGLSRHYVSDARRAEGIFREFKNSADPYLAHENYLPPGFLVEVVQHAFGYLRKMKEYSDQPPKVLDLIIGKWLGYSETEMRLARVGGGHYRRLRGCVNSEFRARTIRGSRKTYDIVRRAYREAMRNPEYEGLPLSELDNVVADKTNLHAGTVRRVRLARENYKDFGGIDSANRLRRRGPTPKPSLSQ